ncbi:hypothetical protein M3N55_05645 [Roseibaca sp. V10]|uniref:Clp protease n=1 Tax=Roseinatronobacter domitianus TaxID=2940293 RepID=A0ABT0M0S7_9RHOB|nr:hypothetical protein [Roseibaca domitiana]MCL1628208.1 hypothetical protein [Roseibaca domitiana]
MQDRPVDIYALRALLALAIGGLSIVGVGIARTEALPETYHLPPPPPPQYDLTISDDGQAFEFSGRVDFGLTEALRGLVASNPKIKRITLESKGGYIAEARGVVTVLRSNEIATHVHGYCASACALICAGGAMRSLSSEGQIGFHRYALGHGQNFGMIDPEVEMQRDLAIYRAQSVDEQFVQRLATLPKTPMWYPDHAKLRAVGLVTLP